MDLRVALCQLQATDSPEGNLRKTEEAVRTHDADIYVFPEMFLSSYTGSFTEGFAAAAAGRLQILARIRRCAICIGLPFEEDGKTYDSLLFITDDQVFRYDKMHLARFGPYAEDGFTAGGRPVMVEYRGWKIGLEVCYDIMFPELHRFYGMHGADMVVCASASLAPSRKYMECIAPARSLEETVYTVYVNNTGPCNDSRFFGGSTVYGPLGDVVERLDEGESVSVTELKKSKIERARNIRHHLGDVRTDIDWRSS